MLTEFGATPAAPTAGGLATPLSSRGYQESRVPAISEKPQLHSLPGALPRQFPSILKLDEDLARPGNDSRG